MLAPRCVNDDGRSQSWHSFRMVGTAEPVCAGLVDEAAAGPGGPAPAVWRIEEGRLPAGPGEQSRQVDSGHGFRLSAGLVVPGDALAVQHDVLLCAWLAVISGAVPHGRRH